MRYHTGKWTDRHKI